MSDFVLMKDSSTAPNLQQVQQFVAAGTRVWGIYLGGRTPHVYTRAEVDTLKQGGIQRVVGFWVAPLRKYGQAFNYNLGFAEGHSAWAVAVQLGLTPDGVMISPDIEDDAQGQDVDDYGRGFKDAVRSSSTAAVLVGYGNPGTITSGAFWGYDGVLIADYLDPPAASPYDSRLPVTGWLNRRGLQAVGTHDEYGLGVDTSYLDPWYASTEGDVPMDQAQLASWMADIQAQVAEMAGALTHNRPINGATLYYGATDPQGHAAQVAGFQSDPETTGYSMFSAISGTDKGATYPLPTGPQGPPGPEGPPGPSGPVGVHHHDFTVGVSGTVNATGGGSTSDPI